ncbi:hypothetical protein B0H19DRAFT_1082076 [Mycena capillaripes]|nr:hypothetical protein B0H19DRAFT_1082076 [Mycena capillaripes]
MKTSNLNLTLSTIKSDPLDIQELIECCLDFLRDSKPDLMACALQSIALQNAVVRSTPANLTAFGDLVVRLEIHHYLALDSFSGAIKQFTRLKEVRISGSTPLYGRACCQASNGGKCRIVLHVSKPGGIYRFGMDVQRAFITSRWELIIARKLHSSLVNDRHVSIFLLAAHDSVLGSNANRLLERISLLAGNNHTSRTQGERGVASFLSRYVYQLPTDKKERERLSLQHRLWSVLFGGKLNPPLQNDAINARMAVCDGPAPAVLDVGCGSGSWVIEMGNAHPHAQVLGVDLDIDPSFHHDAPPNVQFRQLDITQEFPHTDGGYAIIHARVVTGHVLKFKSPVETSQPENHTRRSDLLMDLSDGLLILSDAFKPIWADETQPIPLFPNVHSPEYAPPSGSWFAGWMEVWHKISYTHYRTVEMLINDHCGLSLLHQERYLVPMCGSQDNTEGEEDVGGISNSITLGFCHAGIDPVVASGKFTKAQVEEWIRLMEIEWETKPINMTWDIACGVKSG